MRQRETFVRFDPSVDFGRPTIGGSPVETVAGMVWAGETVDTVADEYNLTAHQVLVACWWTARYGTRAWRERWGGWLGANEERLWHGNYERVADPPTKGGGA